ncbi:MAG: hypothetical protein ACOYMA_08125 [Bacteroidia bacterium]
MKILAGESEPFNQFQMQDLTNKVLHELKLDYSNKDQTIKNYASHLVVQVLNGKQDALKVLAVLKDICIELNMEKYLTQFYLLYFAKVDLIDSENQWYIEGINRTNIDEKITACFIEWVSSTI